jgi:hypothetical protein
MQRPDSREPRRKQSIEAITTFAMLVHANERGDSAKVEDAQRTLERLGVVVRIAPTMTATNGRGVPHER